MGVPVNLGKIDSITRQTVIISISQFTEIWKNLPIITAEPFWPQQNS
jgi:hypothetical protein